MSSSSNKSNKKSMTTVLDDYENYNWNKLPQWIREAAALLGYTKKLWDKDKEPSICQKDWNNLSIPQQQAAIKLGYTADLWDDESESDSESDSDEDEVPPETTTKGVGISSNNNNNLNLYCIQLYTETNDYRLQNREGMGISMHANRAFDAQELIMKSPTGPSNYQTLLMQSSSSSSTRTRSNDSDSDSDNDNSEGLLLLSPERKAFAERFLEWQQIYRNKERPDGAAETGFTFTLKDFLRVPDPDQIGDHTLPTENNPSYDMELYENDVLLIEFISSTTNHNKSSSSSSSSSSFPPERRFEVLEYDEAIVFDSEEDYNPKTMKRPPSLCAIEKRSLEVPGHFHNHACGSTATAIDACQEVLSPSTKCERPNDDVSYTTIMTRRALVPGDEITTDYILWHWSNECTLPVQVPPTKDYFDDWEWEDLPLKIVKAAEVLGFSQKIWNNDNDPSVCEKDWKELTSEEQEAAKAMGNTKESWNETEENEEEDEEEVDMDWDEFNDTQKKAATQLGFNKNSWDTDQENPIEKLYWYQLTPEQQKAASIIGYTKMGWDSGDNEEPWFYCCCGDSKCHSANGFRGLKYLPVEEQKRLYHVVEPFVRQQIDWKLYQLEQEKEKEKEKSVSSS